MKYATSLFLVCALAMLGTTASAQGYAVIAHSSVSVDLLNKREIADVFSGKTTLIGGSSIKLFVLPPDNEVSQLFFDKALEMTATKFNQVWLRNAFSGGGSTPTRLGSNAEIIRAVGSTPGAVGYIAKSAVSSAQGVRVLYSE